MRTSTAKAITALALGILFGATAHAEVPSPDATRGAATTDTASAPAAPVDPKTRIDRVYTRIAEATATVDTQDELVTALTTTLDDLMDYEAFARRTLRTSWPDLTKAQRATFIDRFKRLVVVVYAKRFKPRTAFEVDWRGDGVLYRGDAKKEAKVLTTIKGTSLTAEVDYYCTLGGTAAKDRWFVYDFEIDGVSMALNWRRQFERIIKSDGFDALIERIETRIEKDED